MNIDQLVFKLLVVTLVFVRKKFKVPIVKKSSSYCWAINEQEELCLNFFPDENFLSHETSLMLFHIEKLLH
jgi:hypothetical protein